MWENLRKFAIMEWKFGNAGNNDSPTRVKNIYARGADDGFLLGLYFVVLFGLTVASLTFAWANILVIMMALGVPFITYLFLRRTYVAAHGLTTFSALWMQGITMFACGCLILGFAGFVYLRWIDPGFTVRVLQLGVDYYNSVPSEDAHAIADELRTIADSRLLPSALNMVMGWMWLGMFSGSLLSMAVAAAVKLRKIKR